MYNAICDYAKLFVCKQLPFDVSQKIFEMAQDHIQRPVKEQMRKVCVELQSNQHTIYLNLLSEFYERHIDNYEQLQDLQPEDFFTQYYLSRLTFDISVCSQSIDIHDAFSVFEKFLLHNKAKDGYISAMQYVLGS